MDEQNKQPSAMKRKIGWDFSFLDKCTTKINKSFDVIASRLENPGLRKLMVKARPGILITAGLGFGIFIFGGVPFAAIGIAILFGVYDLTVDQIKLQEAKNEKRSAQSSLKNSPDLSTGLPSVTPEAPALKTVNLSKIFEVSSNKDLAQETPLPDQASKSAPPQPRRFKPIQKLRRA